MNIERLSVTPEAVEVIEKLKKENGELVFNQSGGCCDGTAPMCYKKGDFYVPSRNVKLGEICGCEFFIDKDQFEYFRHSQITIDVKEEKSAFGNSFSLEIDLGYQFITKSRIFTDEEYAIIEGRL
ncbi:MAG: UDP-glucose 4-epimerase [Sulfuricurvum sp. RIFCSPHIGHO2_02_FULL_43_9]|nr:MAG: UDP-glucose 4-epimerase [Sulfuricurvum sp. RIFCSPHIGHO2_02_FULL_43_9]